MANELVHSSAGTVLTQAEFEAIGLHVCNSQATGDLIYASSATQLSRLAVGTGVLYVSGGVPTWSAAPTLTSPTINGTIATTGLTMPAFTLSGTITGAAQILSNLGKTYIGDTADTNVTLGLTINQGAADDKILTFKSSDIAHPITGQAEADTFGFMQKSNATGGGIVLVGITTAGGVAYRAINLQGFLGKDANTGKVADATGRGIFSLNGFVYDGGTSVTSVNANGNIVSIESAGVPRFIFDAEGSGHADVEWTTYQEHDDLALVADIEQELLLREDKSQTLRRRKLEEMGIIGKDSWHMENDKPKAMVNFTKLSMLHHGALIQLYNKMNVLELENNKLKNKIDLLRGG